MHYKYYLLVLVLVLLLLVVLVLQCATDPPSTCRRINQSSSINQQQQQQQQQQQYYLYFLVVVHINNNMPFTFWKNHEPATFVTVYVLSGLVAVLIPVIKHSVSVRRYNQYAYNNYNYDQGNDNNSGDQGWTDVNNCKWWKVRCTSLWINANGVRISVYTLSYFHCD
jgi:NADH:ubiquinone oxidoreductase subunit 3 (subunit A)